MPPPLPRFLLVLPALFTAALCWLGASAWATPQREPDPEAAERRLNQLSVALRDFSYLLVLSDKEMTPSPTERFRLVYELMDQRLDLPRGSCEKHVPELARIVIEDPEATPAFLACSHFVLGSLDKAEAAALKGTEDKRAKGFMKTLAWRIASDIASERGDPQLALKRIRQAVKYAGPDEEFAIWSTVQFQFGRLLLITGEKTEMVKAIRGFHAGTAKHFGPLSRESLEQHHLLANWFLNFGLYAEAEAEFRALLKNVHKTSGRDSEEAQVVLLALAQAVAGQDRAEEAEALSKTAKPSMSPPPQNVSLHASMEPNFESDRATRSTTAPQGEASPLTPRPQKQLSVALPAKNFTRDHPGIGPEMSQGLVRPVEVWLEEKARWQRTAQDPRSGCRKSKRWTGCARRCFPKRSVRLRCCRNGSLDRDYRLLVNRLNQQAAAGFGR